MYIHIYIYIYIYIIHIHIHINHNLLYYDRISYYEDNKTPKPQTLDPK